MNTYFKSRLISQEQNSLNQRYELLLLSIVKNFPYSASSENIDLISSIPHVGTYAVIELFLLNPLRVMPSLPQAPTNPDELNKQWFFDFAEKYAGPKRTYEESISKIYENLFRKFDFYAEAVKFNAQEKPVAQDNSATLDVLDPDDHLIRDNYYGHRFHLFRLLKNNEKDNSEQHKASAGFRS